MERKTLFKTFGIINLLITLLFFILIDQDIHGIIDFVAAFLFTVISFTTGVLLLEAE